MEKNILREANILFHKNDFDRALSLYKQAQQVFPDLHESLELIISYTKRQRAETLPSKDSVETINRDRFGNIIKEKVVIDENDPRLTLVKPASLEEYFFEQIVASGLFDPRYYLSQYYDELVGADNLLENYLVEGIEQKRNPSNQFDTAYYLKHNPDVAQADVNPFLHYVGNGRFEGREAIPKPYDPPYEVAPIEYIERLPLDKSCTAQAVRTICFYLPQFHAIPENDEWWGKGFTEWTNVKPAKPQFEGHYQPHVPDDFLGYYNLLEKETQRKQIELAKQYGIGGFCYYLYWFSGQRLLEQPLDNMLADKSLDFPFCVCWANENWSRRWDGLDNDLLMVQDYSAEDDIAFIENTAKYLKDERYIKINGKPLLMIYRPNLFPDMRATAKRWRNWCRENGVGEIYLAYPQSFESVPPEEYDFDAAVEFPPNKSNPPNITEFQTPVVKDFQSTVYDWRVFVERSKDYKDVDYTLFRGLTPSWDNTARKKNKGTVFQNSCPKLFEQNAVDAFNETKRTAKTNDEQIVFINAWNEWAEGAHLEPDQRYGYAWLEAIKNAHEHINKKKNSILIVSHDAHPHGAQILCLNMAKEFKQKLGIDVELVVLGEGVMLKKYAQYAAVHQFNLESMSERDISERLKRIKDSSLGVAIVNTTVSGTITPYLKKEGFNVVSLIHELPNVLNDMHLEKHAELIAQNADQIIFPAHQVLDGFENFIGKKLANTQIRPQGIYLPSILRDGQDKERVKSEVRKELNIPSTSQIIMCAGYADHRKGFDIFVESALVVMSSNRNVYALWLGHWDKPFVTEVLASITDKKLRDRFILPGIVDDPRRYYVAADVYALTSREDPFPSVVMESLDALTPVVAFKESGGFENLLVRDCGLLVEKGNVSAYSTGLTQILDNVDLAQRLAKQGQAIVKEELSFYHYLFDLLKFGKAFFPKVSVVIPNYNYEKYIESRLTSVFSQTYPIFEIIVLDDKSTDNSVKKIEEVLKRTNIPSKLIVNETNSGSVFKQWQKGAEIANGDYLWIAEADDLAEPKFLEKLVLFFKNPELVLAFSQSKQIDQDSNLLANNYLDYTKDVGIYWQEDYVVDGKEEVQRALCIKNTIPNVSGALFRKESFLKTIQSLEYELLNYKVAGDWLVYLKLAQLGKVGFCKDSLNLHRRHVSSVTKKHDHLNEIISIQDISLEKYNINKNIQEKIISVREDLSKHFKRESFVIEKKSKFLNEDYEYYESELGGNLIVGETSACKTVIIGKDQVFLYQGGNNYSEWYKPVDKESFQIASAWSSIFSTREKKLKDLGIKFLQVIVPNKASILPGSYPDGILKETKTCLMRQLLLKEDSSLLIPLYDMRNAPFKKSIFRKTDSHLTLAGNAFLVELILKKLSLNLSGVRKITTKVAKHTGDLGSKLKGIEEQLHIPVWTEGLLEQSSIVLLNQVMVKGFNGTKQAFQNRNAIINKKIIIFGNSFFERNPSWGMLPFFVAIFEEVHFIWSSDIDYEYITKESPDFVICQTVERFLPKIPDR